MKRLVLHFDFGYSYQNNISVKQQIFDRLPATISLALGAAVIWLVIGIAVGIISAVKRRSLLDRVDDGRRRWWRSRRRSTGSGLVSLYLFANDIGKFPIRSSRAPAATCRSRRTRDLVPVAAPAVVRAGRGVRRALRAAPAREPDRDDVGGLHPHRARQGPDASAGSSCATACAARSRRSSRRPASTSAILLGGAILTETVFNIPGIGRLAYDSIQNSDLPMIQGTVLLGAFFIIIANLVVDIALRVPRPAGAVLR